MQLSKMASGTVLVKGDLNCIQGLICIVTWIGQKSNSTGNKRCKILSRLSPSLDLWIYSLIQIILNRDVVKTRKYDYVLINKILSLAYQLFITY
jgi:hypothetical protein